MNRIADHWWMLLARGVTSFALAALLLLAPGWSSIRTLVLAFGIWALVDGAGSLAFVSNVAGARIATYVGRGCLGLALGAFTLALSTVPTTALYVLVAAWAIGTGALEIAFGSRTWSTVPRALGFMLVGALPLGFGLTLLHFPLESAATLRGFLVAFAVVNGIAATAMGEGLHAGSVQARPAT